ncbi:uncharacterized protein LOC123264708 [Cotesia glomerata]|uniref:Uncharacterized protein n=1 Tax=Cotesia glomerata TaxID=32391 RepID=A0AAV7IY13_COTGL|nr:uncharacterized protein LOC123264708 [Cotesia glomerata]KAH0561732.1 hypothetical protein KQX54_019086 [Cotesia glomerata]
MAEDQKESKKEMECEENLPAVVASMESLSVDASSARYSLRTRGSSNPPAPTPGLNRRCNSRPKKRSYSTSETDAQRKAYYLDKNIKNLTHNTLETIYEEYDSMSSKKFKRLIDFTTKAAKLAKVNKRTNKIKRLFGTKTHMKSKLSQSSIQALAKKLDSILAQTATEPQ